MNNSQVAHLWANQSKQSAKGSNFYFEGDTIYSYGSHFPIARIIATDLIFMNSSNYSNSTTKHKGYVRSAIDYTQNRVIELPCVRIQKKSSDFTTMNAKNLYYFSEKICRLHSDFEKSRKYKEEIQKEIEKVTNDYQFYCKMFKVKINKNLVNFDKEKYFKEVEKQIKKNAKEAEIQRVINYNKNIEQNQKALNLFLNNDEKLNTLNWRAGTNFLKIVGEKCITNNGAEVETKKVKYLVQEIKRNATDIVSIDLGNFTINSLDEKGIKIGCHFFDTQEINRIIQLFK